MQQRVAELFVAVLGPLTLKQHVEVVSLVVYKQMFESICELVEVSVPQVAEQFFRAICCCASASAFEKASR